MARILLTTTLIFISLFSFGQDFTVTAPYTSPSRSTCGAGDDCVIRTSEDHQYQVTIPNAGNWVFSVCGASFDTYMHIGTTLCSSDVAINDDGCGTSSIVTATIAAGTYHVTIEDYFGCGTYVLDIYENAPAGPEDLCSGAIPISCGGSASGTTVGYGADVQPFCTTGDGTGGGVWYVHTGTGNNVTASLCGSGYDTKIRVFSGTCGSLSCVVGNDDFCGSQSEVSFPTTVGATYYILVHGFLGSEGAYTLNLTCPPPAGPEDNCVGAIPIACGGTATGTTVGYAADIAPTCTTTDGTGGGVWYVHTGTGNNVTASLCGSSYDTRIRVFTGTCATLTCVGGNDDFCGNQSQVSFPTTAGVSYYILVHGYSGNQGSYTLNLTCPPPAGPEDSCTGAIPIACGATATGTTVGFAPDVVPTCGTGDGTGGGVWYVHTGTGTSVTASLCGSSFDTRIRVYSGSCAALTCVTGNDDATSVCSPQSQVTFAGLAGVDYYILVHGFSANEGAYSLALTCAPPAGPEDFCTGAIPIACGGTASGSTVTYTSDSPPSCVTSSGSGGGVWYQFAGTDDYVTASLCGSTFDTQIQVFSGSCGSLVCLTGNDTYCSSQSQVSFTSVTGTTYYILVYGWGTAQGNYSLSVTCGAATGSTGADCGGAITICNDVTFSGNSSGAGTFDDLDFANDGCLSGENQSSWYTFQAATSGTIAFDISTSIDYDFAIWGPYSNPTCPPSAAPLRCSYSAEYGTTGLNSGYSDTSEDSFGDRFVSPITAVAGDIFIMVIDNYSQDFTAFSLDWSLGAGCTLDCTPVPLPIELVQFHGKMQDGAIRLDWTTSTEINNDHFTVERSKDGTDFHPIADVPGVGNSSHETSYVHFDQNPLPGRNYYRLMQTDFDGTQEYFHTISVHYDADEQFSLYPNPGSGDVKIIVNANVEDEELLVIFSSPDGTEHTRIILAPGDLDFDSTHLPAGLYIVTVSSPSISGVERFVKK